MHILTFECAIEDRDRFVAELWEFGTTGIVEGDMPGGGCTLRAFFDEPFDATAWAPAGARWETAEERNWVEVSQSLWEPVLAGERFFLVPAWRADPTPPGRLRLEMQPGLGCGTGWGLPTQLALEAMEHALRPGMSVLDLGTGSGILAVAAARLSAGRIYACDIDLEAAATARERFRGEGLDVGLFGGSVRSVRDGSVDFLVANINAEVLTSLAPEILRVLTPHGSAALTGFPERHIDRVRAAFAGRGRVLQKGEWRALLW